MANMSVEDIKKTLTNIVKKTSEKSVQNAEYDKTVLATIQTCTDATIGRYKIKYQNGYFTAYAQDTTVKYSNNAVVYVTIPKNNLNNRLIITGLATDDSSARTYVMNYEGDQQYATKGCNLITMIPTIVGDSSDTQEIKDIKMASATAVSDKSHVIPVYQRLDETYNLVYLGNSSKSEHQNEPAFADRTIKEGGGYFRLGASFRTHFAEEAMYSGNYGIKIVMKFYKDKQQIGASKPKFEDKIFTLDTYSMNGTPYNFIVPTEQYVYFPIDTSLFYRIESISAFAEHFSGTYIPEEELTEKDYDIFISNITLFAADKLYETSNDKYKIDLLYDTDTFESGSDDSSSIIFEARLRVDGNEVKNPKQQGLKYYWAIEDATVREDSKGRYNQYTGKGWRCINSIQVKEYKDASASLRNQKSILEDTDSQLISQVKKFTWKADNNTKEVYKSSCPGRVTKLKCVIIYNNIPVSTVIEIKNLDGMYLVINISDDQTEYYGGIGTKTLTAGVFKDASGSPRNVTLPVSSSTETRPQYYIWQMVDQTGQEISLPPITYDRIIIDDVGGDWLNAHKKGTDPDYPNQGDDETVDDNNMILWLSRQPENWNRCKERYDYYASVANNTKLSSTARKRARERKNQTLQNAKDNILTLYTASTFNDNDAFIFGPSDVVGKYETSGGSTSVVITETIPYYYGSSSYNQYKDVNNTLRNLSGAMVGRRATLTCTAVGKNGNALTSESIVLQEGDVTGLDYTLEIVNGIQSFVYTVGGIAPTSKTVSSPITLTPLYFRLIDKDGNILYNSEEPDSSENVTNLNELKPVWTYSESANSLLLLKYGDVAVTNTKRPGLLQVKNTNSLVYNLKEKFDLSKRDTSNIQLSVTYEGQQIYGSTNFTFIKEGELGTNGTGRYLEIKDPVYEVYKDSILTNSIGAKIKEKVNGIYVNKFYSPEQRHLKNTYLYATRCYSQNGTLVENGDIRTNNFCNLRFAGEMDNDGNLIGSNYTTLYADWVENGVISAVSSSSKWTVSNTEGYNANNDYVSAKSPFNLQQSVDGDPKDPLTSTSAVIKVANYNSNPSMAYKPLKIDNFPRSDGGTAIRTSSNTVEITDTRKQNYSELDEEVSWANYGFYQMPFFYYFDSAMADGDRDTLDPARHVVITGGFDEVIYDSAGRNPQYDKTDPFKIHVFNSEGKDITQRLTYTWECSKGFVRNLVAGPLNSSGTNTAPTYPSGFNYTDQLYGKYCQYNGKTYKCIVAHTKPKKAYTLNLDGQEVTVAKDGFIREYWEEISDLQELRRHYSCNFTPLGAYETLAKVELFNSWVSVVGYYSSSGRTIVVAGLIPINIICNRYGSEEINGWNGKKTTVNDSYIISSKVAAGKKYEDNSFCGITIGENFYDTDTSTTGNLRKSETGLFGYGRTKSNDPNSWQRTLFLDAESGAAILGPSGGTQIVLNPKVPTKATDNVWSRLSGWYFSTNYLYKPIGEGNPYREAGLDHDGATNKQRDQLFTSLTRQKDLQVSPSETSEGSIGLYCPWAGGVEPDDVFIWASSKVKDMGDEDVTAALNKYKRQLTNEGIAFDKNGNKTTKSYNTVYNSKNKAVTNATKKVDVIQRAIHHLQDESFDPEWTDAERSKYATIINTTDIDVLQTMLVDANEDLQTAQDKLQAFLDLVDNYEDALSQHNAILTAESGGYPTSWKDTNKKKSNFYVTYGGHLHAASADIEGHIVANSGRFGNGSNKISIAVTKDNKKYILYNKNFWVRDSSGDSNEESAIFMKGKIMAESGQFGQVGDDKDGYSSNTVFIEYTWYRWQLPGDSEPWDDSHYYLDTTSGKSVKYALYHKNFHIRNDGEVFFKGKLYTKEGRIGDWIIDGSEIKSVRQEGQSNFISMKPTGLRLGTLYLNPDGSIGNQGAWWIDKDGKASFSNGANTFKGASFTTAEGASFGKGLHLATGESMTFGDSNVELTANNQGFSFKGKANFQNDIGLSEGADLQLGANSSISIPGSYGSMILNKGGITFQDQGGSFSIDYSGNANFKSFKIGGNQIIDSSGNFSMDASHVKISGQSIENYIKSVIDTYRYSLSKTTGYVNSGENGVNNQLVVFDVELKSPSS